MPKDNFGRASNSVSLRREEFSVFIPNFFKICFGFQMIIKLFIEDNYETVLTKGKRLSVINQL